MRVYHVCIIRTTTSCDFLRPLALGSYRAQELLCSRKLKTITLLCGWKLKPKELLCTDILACKELYQDVMQSCQEWSDFSSTGTCRKKYFTCILHVKRHSNYDESGKFLTLDSLNSKAQFRHQTFHEVNLIQSSTNPNCEM